MRAAFSFPGNHLKSYQPHGQVIGADGHNSLVRAAIVAEYSEDELETIHTVVG